MQGAWMYQKLFNWLASVPRVLIGLAMAASLCPGLASGFACDTIDPNATQPSEAHLAEIGLLNLKDLQDRAEAGDATAQNALGTHFALGIWVPKNAATSFQWHLRAAKQGLSIAQSNVGVLYMTGDGVDKDLAQAVFWARKSAAQGDSHGEQLLGSLYGQGLGVDKDPKEAEACYLRSADQGNIESQGTLVRIYSKGLAGSVEPDKASLWQQRVSEGLRTGKPWRENADTSSVTTDPATGLRSLMNAIYVYRLTPSEIVTWCDRTNPEGSDERHQILERWGDKHGPLFDRIDKVSALAAPQAALPGGNVDVVAYLKAGATEQADKMMFRGKTAEETTQICSRFTDKSMADIDAYVLPTIENVITELQTCVATHQPGTLN